LARFLPGAVDDYDPGSPLTATLLSGGRSNLTCLLEQPGRRWVLRRPPLGHVLPSAHDMPREFRTLTLLAGGGYPAPAPLALCEDISVIGVPFLLMGYVAGQIVVDPVAAAAFTPDQAGRLCGDLIGLLARLHAIPPPALAANRSTSSVRYLERQLDRWTSQWTQTRTRDLGAFDRLADRLRAALGRNVADQPVTLVHGDYRLDNLVLDPDRKTVRAVLDWEMSTLGDPLMDFAVLLVYWEDPGDGLRRRVIVARDLTTHEGFWSRRRLADEYLKASGFADDRLDLCLGLACLKLAVIMESVHYRHLAGQALDGLSTGLADAAPALVDMGLNVISGAGLDGLATL
jgi:aminoglycoside phosphotransferase (APT) family kinase protein